MTKLAIKELNHFHYFLLFLSSRIFYEIDLEVTHRTYTIQIKYCSGDIHY